LSNKERKRIPRDKTSRHFQILEAQASQASRIITTGGEGPEKRNLDLVLGQLWHSLIKYKWERKIYNGIQ
jgi:hypothetical protein